MSTQQARAIQVRGLEKSYKRIPVLRGVDFFNLWSVALMGLGFSSAPRSVDASEVVLLRLRLLRKGLRGGSIGATGFATWIMRARLIT